MYSVVTARQNDMKVLQFHHPPGKAKICVGPLVNLAKEVTINGLFTNDADGRETSMSCTIWTSHPNI